MTDTAASAPTTRKFEAEVNQVMNLMVNALYSNREIFLRELISNAADALDRLRFAALSDDQLLGDDTQLRIELTAEPDHKRLTIRDNGVGMTAEEAAENLGTIARSGTAQFAQALKSDAAAASELIGQFGVGFYSAFTVADKVTVRSRAAQVDATEGVVWQSEGEGQYTVEAAEIPWRGTEVVLELKEDASEYAQPTRIKTLIHKYSDHIAFPILLNSPSAEESADDEEKEDGPERINQASALWRRPKQDIEEADYQSFYKHVAHDFSDPLAWTHNKVEGARAYTALLYIPSRAPMDILMGQDERQGLKLYVRRVFIMDAAEQLLPRYLRFIRGVVDSDDLPLNVSREMLQENPVLDRIRAAVVKRSLDLLGRLADNQPEKYRTFWQQFGQVLKEGPAEDPSNVDTIARLLRFASTRSDGKQTVSLSDYVSRMQAEQTDIYVLTAESIEAARNSPHLEAFAKRDIEVLLLGDRVDSWLLGHLQDFDGKPLKQISDSDVALPGDDESKLETPEKVAADKLAKRLSEILGDQVETVRPTTRLTDSPSRVVIPPGQLPLHVKRMFEQAGQPVPDAPPILEINPDHALVKRLADESDNDTVKMLAGVLLDQAILAQGGQLEDAAGFVRRINKLLAGQSESPIIRV